MKAYIARKDKLICGLGIANNHHQSKGMVYIPEVNVQLYGHTIDNLHNRFPDILRKGKEDGSLEEIEIETKKINKILRKRRVLITASEDLADTIQDLTTTLS